MCLGALPGFFVKARSPKRALSFLIVQFSAVWSAFSFCINGHSASTEAGACLYPLTIVLGTQCSVFTSNRMIP